MNIILNQLEIETCSLCNRKCPWCLFGQIPDFRGNELQFLEIRYIEKIFRELNRNHFKGIINFYSMNEPLLDKRITDGELFRLCRKYLNDLDVKMCINTNGDLLENSNIERMTRSGLERINVSCYSEPVLEKVTEMRKKFKEIIILDYTNERAKLLIHNRAGAITSYSGHSASGTKSCSLPVFSTVIGFDGNVRLCCNDALGKMKVGNIMNNNLYDILNQKNICKLRNKILVNRKTVSPCSICNFEEVSEHKTDFFQFMNYGTQEEIKQ